MPTKRGSHPDHPLRLFLADEPELVILSRLLKASVLVASAAAIGVALFPVENPTALFTDLTASLADKSALQPGNDQSAPTIQSSADAQPMPPTDDDQALPPTTKEAANRDEIAAAPESTGQNQTEISEPSSEGLFRRFQAWAADRGAQTQVAPVQSVHDASERAAENSRVHRHVRPIHNARAEIRPMQNPRRKVRREQKPPVQPAQYARAQDQSAQNARAPSFLETFGWRNYSW